MTSPVFSPASLRAAAEARAGALLVQTHRDPITAVASVCSLNATLRQAWSDTVPLAEGAASDAAYTAEAISRAAAYRREHPDVDVRVHDVAFKRFIADSEGPWSACTPTSGCRSPTRRATPC